MLTYTRTRYGGRIKDIRRNKGITQSELAERLGEGWMQADISQLEGGKRAVTLDTAAKICSVLGVTVDELINEKLQNDA